MKTTLFLGCGASWSQESEYWAGEEVMASQSHPGNCVRAQFWVSCCLCGDVLICLGLGERVGVVRKVGTSLGAQTVENLPTLQETQVQSLGQEDSPGEGNGNPLQYSCLKNPMERSLAGTVHGITKSRI